jgi:outer membrane protein assembly factor BamB
MSLEVVDLPEGVEYTFRGVARGPDELAYLIGTDGAVHVLDPESGELTASWPVIDAWDGPLEWQDPHPAIVVADGIGYVTEPATNSVHSVDLATGDVVSSTQLDVTPNEIAPAVGE